MGGGGARGKIRGWSRKIKCLTPYKISEENSVILQIIIIIVQCPTIRTVILQIFIIIVQCPIISLFV